MDTSNERPTQGAHSTVGELTMDSGDWRSQMQRQRIMNKILDILKKFIPFSGYEGHQELKKIAEWVEEEIYTAATNQSDYSRKICFNLLSIETRLQNPMSGPSIPKTNNLNGGDWQEEVYQKIKTMKKLYELEYCYWRAGWKAELRQQIVNKMIKSWHHPSLRPEELQELKKIAVRFEEKTYIVSASQAEYLHKISLKMMKMENRLKYPMLSNSTANGENTSDPGSQVMQQVNNQGEQFSIPVTSNSFQQIMPQSMNTNIGSIDMQGSSSLLSVGNITGYNNFANQRQIPGRQQLIPQQLPQQQPQTQNSYYLYQQQLQQIAKQAHIQQQQQMRSHMMHNNIGSTGMQGSSSLSSAMLPGPIMHQPMLHYPMLHQPMLQQRRPQQMMLQQQRNVVQQNQQRLKPTEGESGDWRDQLSADSRQRMQKKIMNTLRRHLPSFGEQELDKFAKRIEEGFYAVTTSQCDYLRKISLKMLSITNNSLIPI